MKKIIPTLIATVALAVPAAAQQAMSFASMLGQARGKILQSHAAQIKDKQTNLAQEIGRAADDVARLEGDLKDLNKAIDEVRTRSRRYPDRLLGEAAQRLAWGLRGFYTSADYLSAHAARLRRFVRYGDPSLVKPVDELYGAAKHLRFKAELMANASWNAADDLRRVGFELEASSVRQQTVDAVNAARDLEMESWRLRAAVGK
ncbi:MAG: hypothetical protein ABIJ96_04890 [Elusimicrobiota bacterium]